MTFESVLINLVSEQCGEVFLESLLTCSRLVNVSGSNHCLFNFTKFHFVIVSQDHPSVTAPLPLSQLFCPPLTAINVMAAPNNSSGPSMGNMFFPNNTGAINTVHFNPSYGNYHINQNVQTAPIINSPVQRNRDQQRDEIPLLEGLYHCLTANREIA